MDLQHEIEKARAEIKTDSYSISIGEWINLYQDNELDIHPEFQRFFRWSRYQKARFIESILLGIPIPPIFVAQNEEGIWDVVDGLQRLSTIYEFIGILRNEDGEQLEPLALQGTKYLPALENKSWDHPEDLRFSFTTAQRLYVKRSKLDVSIILRESDEKAKYELFQRLNTGGSPLSSQEVRNCIIVMLDRSFYFWLRTLAENKHFQESVALTDRAQSEQYDMELVLRFLIFRRMDASDLYRMKDVGEFLTERMVEVLSEEQLDLAEEEKVFTRTFERIATSLSSSAFCRYVPERQKFYGGFLLSAFEVVALGIGFHGGDVDLSEPELRAEVEKLWSNEDFQKWSGSGVRASSRVPKLIPFGRRIFER